MGQGLQKPSHVLGGGTGTIPKALVPSCQSWDQGGLGTPPAPSNTHSTSSASWDCPCLLVGSSAGPLREIFIEHFLPAFHSLTAPYMLVRGPTSVLS